MSNRNCYANQEKGVSTNSNENKLELQKKYEKLDCSPHRKTNKGKCHKKYTQWR